MNRRGDYEISTDPQRLDVATIHGYLTRSVGKWLVECVLAHADRQGLRRWMLATRDAHGLYGPLGFSPLANPGRPLEIVRPDICHLDPGAAGDPDHAAADPATRS